MRRDPPTWLIRLMRWDSLAVLCIAVAAASAALNHYLEGLLNG